MPFVERELTELTVLQLLLALYSVGATVPLRATVSLRDEAHELLPVARFDWKD